MFSRFTSVFSITVIIFWCLLGLVYAEEEDRLRIGDEVIDRTIQLRTHSIYAPYIDQDLQNRWWDFGADAYINTNKHIRLTQNRPSQMGWLWSRLGMTVPNYIIEIEFKISGESSHLFGDGLAVWLTKDRAVEGPVFGNGDNFVGLGIFLDTYANGHQGYSFPRINAMLGDGKTSYSVADDGEPHILAGCSANFRRTNVATKLKIIFFKDKFLDVKLQHRAWDDWTDCFHLKNVTLPPNPYLGFSAMTGDVSDAHDIITVTSYSAFLAQPDAPQKKKSFFSSSTGDATSSSWSGIFFKLFLLVGACVGGYYGWREYQRRQAYVGGGNFGVPRGGGFGTGGFGYSSDKRAF